MNSNAVYCSIFFANRIEIITFIKLIYNAK